jgi:hypothetical protein
MSSVRGRTRLLLALAAGLLMVGCSAATRPVVWANQDVAFSDYHAFVVRPVFNATGTPVEAAVLDRLTEQLRAQFAANRLALVDAPEVPSGVLLVHSELLVFFAYEPVASVRQSAIAGEGETRCTLKTRLIDLATNKAVAEIVTAKVRGAGGVYPVPFVSLSTVNTRAHERVLHEAAKAVAGEVAVLMGSSVPR